MARGIGGKTTRPTPEPLGPYALGNRKLLSCKRRAQGSKEPIHRMPDLTEFTRKWRPVRHIWPIVAAACLGLAVAVAAWFAVSVWEERLARAKFNAVAGDYASVLQNGLDQYLNKIVDVRAFYDSSHAVDLNEFETFTSRILEDPNAIMRITWSPRVTGDERSEFERKAREEGIEDYQIRAWATGGTPAPASQEDAYYPVLYSTGIPAALSVLGIDFSSALIDSILASATLPQDVDLYLYPAGARPGAGPAYTRISPEHTEPVEAKSQAQLAAMTHWSAPLKAGDASWKLVVIPMQGGLISFYRAWLVFAAVILMFAAVLAYMWASLRHALRLERANSRILELAQTDLLTNLANRRAFIKRLTMAFTATWRGAPPFAVLYLDIDNFKDVNDTLGHAMGRPALEGGREPAKKRREARGLGLAVRRR